MKRRNFLIGVGAFAALGAPLAFSAPQSRAMVVHFDPLCGCCSDWITHMREAGFAVESQPTQSLDAVKERLGVPLDLSSCHTAEIDGYVIEGHVPAEAVERLLRERPSAIGLSVPGMPIGSPGMDVAGVEGADYDVILFGPEGGISSERYRGPERIDS